MPFRRSIFVSASEDRLQKLIAARLEPEADKDSIDRRVWDLFGEEWCIMTTDLMGFSRSVALFGIIHYLQTIYESERLLVPIIEQYDGIMLKMEGDSFLVIFRNVQKALFAAVGMQRSLKLYNETRTPEEQVLLGMGLGYGRVLRIGDQDVFGLEVNAAYVLGEDIAGPYEILVSAAVRSAAKGMAEIFEEISDAPTGIGAAYRVRYDA